MHVLRLDGLDSVSVQEEEPPITHGRPLAELQRDLLRVVERLFEAVEHGRPGPIDFLAGDGIPNCVDENLVHRGDRREKVVSGPHLGESEERSGFAELVGKGAGGRGQSGLDQRSIQTSGRLVPENLGQDVDRCVVRVGTRGHVV